ncbi:type I restriction endonuclease subunit S [Actinomyces ruminis]|uniref:Type I restriction endonuclease subunit S n=1 Tax=Actinomyces ruminis TaxID=1937003 RepID=A0ABX4M8N3_9ACTO|nr:type I restriction endonuclease subunit S [Actinomyces ruminis]
MKADDLADLTFPLTKDARALERFESHASSELQLAQTLAVESHTLAELRDALLPPLMDGTLRVKDAVAQVEEVL